MKTRFRNFTPYTITLKDGTVLESEGVVKDTTDLPDMENGVKIIISSLLVDSVKREDIVFPSMVRKEREVYIVGRRRYYENNTRMFNAWFDSYGKRYFVEVDVNVFERGRWVSHNKVIEVFDYNGKTYYECGIDHFNGHFSGFRDRTHIYGVYLRPVKRQ